MNGKLTYFTTPPIVDDEEDLDEDIKEEDIGMVEANPDEDEEVDEDEEDDDDMEESDSQ